MGPAAVLKGDTGNKLALCAAPIGIALTVVPMIFVLRPTATQLQRLLGVTGQHGIARIFALLLMLLVMQFVFDGLQESGLFG